MIKASKHNAYDGFTYFCLIDEEDKENNNYDNKIKKKIKIKKLILK